MDQLKVCSCCKVAKEKAEYNHNRTRKDGRDNICKGCKKQWREANKDRRKIQMKEWYIQNRDKAIRASRINYRKNQTKYIMQARVYYQQNKEMQKANMQKWTAHNPDKANAIKAKRRSKKLNATPPWLTKAQLKEIAQIYKQAKRLEEQTKKKFHVDHIIPLQGKDVCGLHVPWNLQILTAEENIKKGNRL